MIELRRAQIGRYAGRDRMDVTVKSAKGNAKKLAPAWEMVMGYKAGTLSAEAYTRQYHAILDRVEPEVWDRLVWWGEQAGGSVTFLCYCQDGSFCHTYLLIEWLAARFPDRFEVG